jgi:hypothetical protein
VVARFLAATNRGWNEAFADPNGTAAMLVTKYLPGKDKQYQRRSIEELHKFAVLESPRLGEMRLSSWQKSCSLFHLDPRLAQQLVSFSILQALYGKD